MHSCCAQLRRRSAVSLVTFENRTGIATTPTRQVLHQTGLAIMSLATSSPGCDPCV